MAKLYLSKEESELLTKSVIEYNIKNNPIKIFNECFDYYVETYNIKPIYCDDWYNVIEIRKDYEIRKIDKSINRSKENHRSTLANSSDEKYDQIKQERYNEMYNYIEDTKQIDPSKGKRNTLECPIIIWSNIEKIAKNYVQNYKFYGYVYKEDLVMDAMGKCLKYLGNFSPASSNNAFSYFTTIIHHSFLETIKKEYDYSNIKQKFNTVFYGASNEEQTKMQEDYYECA